MPYSDEIEALYDLVVAQFNDNTSGDITPADARAVLGRLVDYMANLNTNQVKGALFRVPFLVVVGGLYTVPTALVPLRSRVLGMDLQVTNGTDAGSVAAGAQADPITFRLLAHSQGTIDALIDEKATTTATVKALWVRTSGTAADKIITYPQLILEDHEYVAGEVFRYTFTNQVPTVTRLFMWRAASTAFQHPLPTGLDDDPIYAPFAPLVAAAAYDDTAVLAQLAGHETRIDELESDLVFLENEVVDQDTRLAATESVASTTKQRLDSLVANAPQALDTLQEIANQLASDEAGTAAILATQQQHTTQIAEHRTAIGFLPSLQTSQKGNLVAAINEVRNSNQTFGSGTGGSSLLRLNQSNSATAYQSSVLAGESSAAIGIYSTVISGYQNVTRGHWSVILGGSRNAMEATANGNQAFGIIAGSNVCVTDANFCGIYNSSGCSIAAGCDYTTLIGCTDLSVTAGTHQTYLNNVLVGSTAPGSGITSASLSLAGQTLTLNTSGGSSTVQLPASGGGIDYANPVTLTAAATLQANTAYYVTGTDYTLTLPAAANNAGKAIFINIATDAAGLFPVVGAGNLAMYAAETMHFRATPGGWKKTGGELLPMTIRLETTMNQQDAVVSGTYWQVPLSVEAERIGPPGLRNGANIVIQRSGRGVLSGVLTLKSNVSAPVFVIVRRVRGGNVKYPIQQTFAKMPDGYPSSPVAQVAFSAPIVVEAGDVFALLAYAEGAYFLRGEHPGSECALAYLETV